MMESREEGVDCGKLGKVPVRNIWLLYLYASKLFRHMNERDRVEAEKNPDELPELLAEILAYIAERRMRRSLNLGYRQRSAHLDRVRGRIKFLETERHQLLARGKIACEFEELTADTPRNRYVRAALLEIARKVNARRAVVKTRGEREYRQDLASRCRKVATMMGRLGVQNTRPRDDEVFSVRSSHRDAEDDYMLAAARLAFELALPTRERGDRKLMLPVDPSRGWELFERAVAGFYVVALRGNVWREVNPQKRLEWDFDDIDGEGDGAAGSHFPVMRPDLFLDNGVRVVIDTKFMEVVNDHWNREKFSSANLYQMYAYLRSQESDLDEKANNAAGILLHPQVSKKIDARRVIQGHKIWFCTVDLGEMDSARIRERLLEIVEVDRKPETA